LDVERWLAEHVNLHGFSQGMRLQLSERWQGWLKEAVKSKNSLVQSADSNQTEASERDKKSILDSEPSLDKEENEEKLTQK
jgi:hypothetical protein